MIPQPACPVPKIENKTSVWNDHDKEILNEVQKHCKRIYTEDYCVKVIEKTGENSYRVTCFIPIRVQGEK